MEFRLTELQMIFKLFSIVLCILDLKIMVYGVLVLHYTFIPRDLLNCIWQRAHEEWVQMSHVLVGMTRGTVVGSQLGRLTYHSDISPGNTNVINTVIVQMFACSFPRNVTRQSEPATPKAKLESCHETLRYH